MRAFFGVVAIFGVFVLALFAHVLHLGSDSSTPPAPIVAQAAEHFTADEIQYLTAVCGMPTLGVRQRRIDTGRGQSATEKQLFYPKVEFHFDTAPEEGDTGWTLTGAFPTKGNDALSREEVEARMPCLKKAPQQFSNKLFQLE